MPGTTVSLRAAIDAKRRLDELGTARWIEEAATAVHKAQAGGQPVGKLAPEALLMKDGVLVLEPLASPLTAYSSPERLRGGPGDRRSDVFSLGAILWEALAHQRLFEGHDSVVRGAIERCEIPPVTELNANVPAELEAICKKALARDPADRYQSAKVMAAEISAVLDEAGYPEGVEGITSWIAKELGDTAKPASNNQTVMGIPPMSGQKVTNETQPLSIHDIEVVPLETKKLETKKEPKRAGDTKPPPMATVTPAPSSLPSWAQRPGSTQPPPVTSSPAAPTLLTPPPEPPRGAKIAEALARATAESPPLEPATSTIPTQPGLASPASVNAQIAMSPGSTSPGMIAPLVPAAPILPAAPVLPVAAVLPAAPLVPPTTIPGAAVAVSSPALKLPDAPPGATVSADKPSMFNGATTAIVGSSISTAVPTVTPAAGFSGNRTAVLGSNSIIDAVNAAVSAANPPAPAPAVTPPTAALPPSVVGTPVVKLSEAETIGTPALITPAIPRTPTPQPDIRVVNWDDSKQADSARITLQRGGAPGDTSTAKLPPPADDDFAEVPSSASAKPNLPGTIRQRATSSSTSSVNDRKTGGRDVLAGWGVGTDSHTAMDIADDSYEEDRRTHKKRMILIFGGLGAAVLLVIVIAFAFSGGKKTEDAVAQKPNEQVTPPKPEPAPPKTDPVVDPAKPDPAKVDPAVDPAKPDPATPDPAKPDPATPDPAKPDPAKPDPAKPDPAKPDPAKVEPVKPDPVKVEPKKPDPIKVEPKKPDPVKIEPKKPDPKKPDPIKKDPKKPDVVVKKDPVKPPPNRVDDPTKPKVDAVSAYRTGLQLYAKGDANGALQAFKTSLAADQNSAATWRGIGMVYEKLGRKSQAVTSFKRYLELSPGAPDAENIKARLERLGS